MWNVFIVLFVFNDQSGKLTFLYTYTKISILKCQAAILLYFKKASNSFPEMQCSLPYT